MASGGLKQKARAAAKSAWMHLLYCTGALRRAKRRMAEKNAVVLFNFHRVLPAAEFARTKSPLGMVVRAETFDEICRHTAKNFPLHDLATGTPAWDGGKNKVRIAITFDDAWGDTARVAEPIASQHGVPFAVFACSAKMGEQFPFWPERVTALYEAAQESGEREKFLGLFARELGSPAPWLGNGNHLAAIEGTIAYLKSLPGEKCDRLVATMTNLFGANPKVREAAATDSTMTWDDAAQMQKKGVTFGSHTHTHQILPKIPAAEAKTELATSKQEIEKRLQKPCALFAYPNGDCSPEVRELVAQSGYELAFLNSAGAWTRECDPLQIPRMNVWEGKVTDSSGNFSRVAFDYNLFWLADRAQRKN